MERWAEFKDPASCPSGAERSLTAGSLGQSSCLVALADFSGWHPAARELPCGAVALGALNPPVLGSGYLGRGLTLQRHSAALFLTISVGQVLSEITPWSSWWPDGLDGTRGVFGCSLPPGRSSDLVTLGFSTPLDQGLSAEAEGPSLSGQT